MALRKANSPFLSPLLSGGRRGRARKSASKRAVALASPLPGGERRTWHSVGLSRELPNGDDTVGLSVANAQLWVNGYSGVGGKSHFPLLCLFTQQSWTEHTRRAPRFLKVIFRPSECGLFFPQRSHRHLGDNTERPDWTLSKLLGSFCVEEGVDQGGGGGGGWGEEGGGLAVGILAGVEETVKLR